MNVDGFTSEKNKTKAFEEQAFQTWKQKQIKTGSRWFCSMHM
jgi:hypothetical protein